MKAPGQQHDYRSANASASEMISSSSVSSSKTTKPASLDAAVLRESRSSKAVRSAAGRQPLDQVGMRTIWPAMRSQVPRSQPNPTKS
jgi:hypothetical protein